MSRARAAPTAAALTIGGLDPSGGAGIAADLRAFSAAGAWGCAVCAALTVQSTRGLRSVHPTPAPLVIAQLREIVRDVPVAVIKTGALGATENVRAVARFVRTHASIPVVVDPVMAPSRALAAGIRLDGGALAAMGELARLARLVTPNLDEASALLGHRVTEATARDAAVALADLGIPAVLVKGGHGRSAEAVDWFATQYGVLRLAHRRIAGPTFHGTGCALASLIAGRLARRPARKDPVDAELVDAIRWSRRRLARSMSHPVVIGRGLRVLPLD